MTITLSNGQDIDSTKVQFDAQGQRFYLPNYQDGSVEDITDLLRQEDRISIGGPGYDVNAELIRRSENKQGKKAPSESSTSTLDQFVRNLDDELEPLMQGASDAASSVIHGANKALNAAPGALWPIALIVGVLGVVYLARIFK